MPFRARHGSQPSHDAQEHAYNMQKTGSLAVDETGSGCPIYRLLCEKACPERSQRVGIWLVWDLARVGFARVGRTLLSVAFDVDLDPDFDFDFDREGHGFSRAATRRQKKPGFSRRGKPHPIKGHSFRTGRQAR
jgi:hypothetical protein